MQILKGHTSPETAYIVNDYPYGFRLRCKIRYWLEVNPKLGVRMVSQTTNPKRPGEVWNKEKKSTYCRFGGCMYLDDDGHVQWAGLTEYSDAAETERWIAKYGEGNVIPNTTKRWHIGKLAFEKASSEGKGMAEAAAIASIAAAKSE
jgi:hypothetical protein